MVRAAVYNTIAQGLSCTAAAESGPGSPKASHLIRILHKWSCMKLFFTLRAVNKALGEGSGCTAAAEPKTAGSVTLSFLVGAGGKNNVLSWTMYSFQPSLLIESNHAAIHKAVGERPGDTAAAEQD